LAIQAQVRFILGEESAQFRRATPGQKWWRLGPLRDAELWVAKDLIGQLGLAPLRDELRTARAGPFRSFVYFSAVGTPTKLSLDDGSWTGSEATLQPAEPPPRRSGPRSSPAVARIGSALAPQSSWAGPRRDEHGPPAPSQPSPPAASFPTGASLQTPTIWPSSSTSAPFGGSSHFSGAPGTTGGSSFLVPKAKAGKSGKGRGRGIGPSITAVGSPPGDSMDARLSALSAQVGELLHELRALRQENSELRRQLAVAQGVHQHQPYALPPPLPLAPLPTPSFSYSPDRPAPPGKSRTAGELSPTHEMDTMGDAVMSSPSADLDTKRARRSLAEGIEGAASAPASAAPQGL
jgi:hypothetical protein